MKPPSASGGSGEYLETGTLVHILLKGVGLNNVAKKHCVMYESMVESLAPYPLQELRGASFGALAA